MSGLRPQLGGSLKMLSTLIRFSGTSPSGCSRWEKGQAQPRTKQLAKIEEIARMGLVKAGKKMRKAATG